MTMKKKTIAQRRSNAIGRVETSSMELIYSAERYMNAATSGFWDQKFRRVDLLAAARKYATSINRLARIK